MQDVVEEDTHIIYKTGAKSVIGLDYVDIGLKVAKKIMER